MVGKKVSNDVSKFHLFEKSSFFFSGFSNGALFSSNVALRFSSVIAGICNVCGGLSLCDGVLLPPCTVSLFETSRNQEVQDQEIIHDVNFQSTKKEPESKLRFEKFGSMIPCDFIPPQSLRWPMTWPPVANGVPILVISGNQDTMLLQCQFAAYLLSFAGFPLWLRVRPNGVHEWLISEEKEVLEFLTSMSQRDSNLNTPGNQVELTDTHFYLNGKEQLPVP